MLKMFANNSVFSSGHSVNTNKSLSLNFQKKGRKHFGLILTTLQGVQ